MAGGSQPQRAPKKICTRKTQRRNSPESLLRWLHLQRIIEAIEIIEESNRGQQLHHFTFIKVLAHFIPELIVHGVSIAGNALRQAQCYFFFFREITALLKICQAVDLVVCPAVPSCQDGMRGQSIFAAVDLRGAHDQELFQLCRHGAGVHHGLKVRHHRPHNFRTMRRGAEHVGNVAARLHKVVVDFGDLWSSF